VPAMRGVSAVRFPRLRRLRWAVPIIVVTLLSLGANARAATVTVGSPLSQVFAPTEIGEMVTVANSALPEPGAHVTSPISGTIVRWRVLLAEGGAFKLRVLRPVGGTTFTGVGTSSPETPASLAPQTFATNLQIQVGDTIGLDNNASSARVGSIFPLPGAGSLSWNPPLSDGSTLAAGTSPEREFAFNADVQPPPTVSSISPTSGPSTGGTAVTIVGSDFNGVSAVSFGGLPAAIYPVDSEERIVARSPAAPPGPVDVTVTTVAGKSATGSADVFTYTAPPASLTAPAATVAPAVCRVPKLRGRKLRAAKRALRRRHCRIGKVTRKRRARAPRKAKIIRQHPRPRAIRPAGFKVKVTLLVRAKHGKGPAR
jgi:IPT/TIG domain